MPGPPAICKQCGHAFTADTFDVEGVNTTFRGFSVQCPYCGGEAPVLEGTYSREGDYLRVDVGSPFTRQVTDRLSAIAKRAREEKLKAEDILAEVADVSPEFAEKLKKHLPLPAFVLIMVLIWFVKSVSLDVKVDLNHLIDQAYHLSQRDDPEAHLDDPPPIARTEPKSVARPSAGEKPEAQGNRQARRRAASQSKKKK